MTVNNTTCNIAGSNAQFLSIDEISKHFNCSSIVATNAANWFVRALPRSMWDMVLLNNLGMVSKIHCSLLGVQR